jgi:SAM-dependent methyltransferase
LSDPLEDSVVFDRRALRARRDRAAAAFRDYDFLIREMVDRLVERLGDVRRRFETTLVLGCHTGQVVDRLPRDRIGWVVEADLSEAMVRGGAARAGGDKGFGAGIVFDEEALPFGFDRFDLVIATGNLHLVNDLPGALVQIRYALKPDGLLLAALPGGRTLHELRACLAKADQEMRGEISPRVAPFIDVPDAGALMQRAGYTLPVVDIDNVTVTYDEPLNLLRDLKGMAESNVLNARPRTPISRTVLMEACRLYQERFGDERGRVPATFQLLMLAGWSPGPNQPKPLRRGSGKTSLAKALGDVGGVSEVVPSDD